MTESISTDETTDTPQTLEKLKEELRINIDFKKTLDESSIVAITDKKGTITYVNDTFCKISKYSRDELLGQNHRILKSGFHSPEFYKNLWETISNGKVWKGDIKNKAKDGTFYWVKTIIMPFLGQNGKPDRYIAIRTDISSEKRAVEKLGEMEKHKDEFVAMVSHELKNPLTPIKIYCSALKRQKFLGELNTKQAEAVASISFNALRLERMIGDLLDAQKLELGKIKFENQWIVVEEFMALVTRNLKSQTEQKGGQLINRTKEKIIMKSDTPRLSQVFSNLINNSIDFIPENIGKIEINAQNKKDKVLFSVKDNGSGMTLETQKNLFQKFYQADTTIRRKHGGSGLGLAICKGIVEGLGGEIWLESEVGKGTDVYFTIPRGKLDENIDSR